MPSAVLIQFKQRVETFIERTGLAPSRFGLMACNDPAFVMDMRDGREPKFSTIEKVERFMAEHNASPADDDEQPPQAAE